jgi:hypothetical protein
VPIAHNVVSARGKPLYRDPRHCIAEVPYGSLIPFAEDMLNCLLPWHPDPSISAYHGLAGAQFDFRAHPIAPAAYSRVSCDAWNLGWTWRTWFLYLLVLPCRITAPTTRMLPPQVLRASQTLSLASLTLM